MFARWNLPKKAVEAIKSVKPGTKFKGQKTVGQVQSEAAQSKLKMAKENLDQTLKQTDKRLEKLKKTTDRIKWYQKAADKRRYSKDYYKD
jgi:ElaB/YqjD/DUF883 family membrane-anchored ribosome-binding protein